MEFARQGWNVAIIARDQQRLESAARDLQSYGVRTLALSADVSDFDALDRAAGQVEDELGPIDVWVNNAMATIFAPVRFTLPNSAARLK
jgi:NAD(P)-dependent dehydrogenase (short-subunit alcohol dehydrogenase family)